MSESSPPASLSPDTSALASTLASPGFGVSVALLMLGWLALGTQIPQSEGMEALAGSYPHGWVALVHGLGLDQVWTSWVSFFLLLLLVLNGVARQLAPLTATRQPILAEVVRLEDGNQDEASEFVHRHLTTGSWTVTPAGRVLKAGWMREGLLVLGLGLVAILIGIVTVERERMDVLIGAPAPSAEESPLGWSLQGGDWQPGAVHLAMACGESERLDPRHLRMCKGRVASGESFTGPLGIGHPLRAGDWTVRVVSQSRSTGDVARLVAQDALSMNRTWAMVRAGTPIGVEIDGEGGRTLTHPISVLPGRFGLAAASVDPGGSAWIHGGIQAPESPSPLFLRAEGRSVLRVEASRSPGQFWLVGGAMACLLGILAILLVPHWRISILSDGAGGQLIEVDSLNRPWRVRRLIHGAIAGGEKLEWRTRR